MNGCPPSTAEHRQTHGRHVTEQSPIVITGGREDDVTEEQNRHDALSVKKLQKNRRSSIGCSNTRNLRRCFVTCGFLLRDYNDLGLDSASYRIPVSRRALSGSENESAHPRTSMSNHDRTNGYNHRQTDGSTFNHTPTECPACDYPEITIDNDLWRCTLYNASGVLGGDHT
jgi:hypothetical protein